jgi:hypothetical protein
LAGVAQRFVATFDERGLLKLPTAGVDLRVRATGLPDGHQRRFLPDSAYAPIDQNQLRLLRKADSTGGFFLGMESATSPGTFVLATGEHRLNLTYRRDSIGLSLC